MPSVVPVIRQALACLIFLAATQDFDDQVNDIGGTHETFLDFLFLQFLGKKLLVLAGGQVILKIKEIFNNALETKRLPDVRRRWPAYSR